MLTQLQWVPFVTHNGLSSFPTTPSKHSQRSFPSPLSEISVNTRRDMYWSPPSTSNVQHERSKKAINMSNASIGRQHNQNELFATSAARPWNERSSNSKHCERDASNSSSTPAPSLSTAQYVDQEPTSLITDDATMDSLVSRMQDNVVIRDMAVQMPQMVKVPKGYAVTFDTKPAEHFSDRRNVKVHVKRKREEGVLPKHSRGPGPSEMYGFRAHEINAAGALSLHNCQASNLTNEIHPLLARARFDDTPDRIYDQLVPALRLASMFLSQPVCMQFWVTLALGERRDDPEISSKYGKRCQRINSHFEMTDASIAEVTKRLEDMGNDNLIHFAFRHKTAMPHTDIWGCSWPIREYRVTKDKDMTKSLIRLHADYYIVADKLSQLKYPEQSQNLRFSFIFAVIVLHELAHSIEGAYIQMRHDQWLDLQQTKQYLEPFFMDWERPPECGRTLEQTMFGGEIHPINKRVDGSHGVCTSDWPPPSGMADLQRRTWYTVPMDYIQNLFRMEIWQRRSQLRDWTTFHIPRTGATSLYIFSFTTMSWSEEQRAANEEAAELSAITEAQPATKRRLIASGQGEEQRSNETTVIETVIGKEEAVKAERGRRSPRSPHTRRHSSFLSDPFLEGSHKSRASRRSQSLAPKAEDVSSSSDELTQEATADELLGSFLKIHTSLHAHQDSDDSDKKPTSELVKIIAKQSANRNRRQNHAFPAFLKKKINKPEALKEQDSMEDEIDAKLSE